MRFKTVDETNVNTLYKLNKKLAKKEKQKDLFTASKKEYKKEFLKKNPFVFARLIVEKNSVVGFYIYTYKFATYLASKVLYIEDIYLEKQQELKQVFKHLEKQAKKENLCRIELRVLQNYSLDIDFLEKNRYFKITKWDVYRKDLFTKSF